MKLRSVKDRKIASKKKKQEEKSSGGEGGGGGGGGGDLMSDLAHKLQMRRKGISGTGKQAEESKGGGRGNAMDRISAMIPPPPTPGGSEDAEVEDWE